MAKNSKSLRNLLSDDTSVVRKHSQEFIPSPFAVTEHPHFQKMLGAAVEIEGKSTILVPPTTRAAKSAAGGKNVGFRAGYTPDGNIAFYGKSSYDAVLFRKGLVKFGFEVKDLGAVSVGGYRTRPDSEAILNYVKSDGNASREALVEYLVDEELHRQFASRNAYVYDDSAGGFVRCWVRDGQLQPMLNADGSKQLCPDMVTGETPEINGVFLNYVNIAGWFFLGGCLDVTARSAGLFNWQVDVLNAVDSAAYARTDEDARKALNELIRREQYQLCAAAAKNGSAKELYIQKRDELSYGKLNG